MRKFSKKKKPNNGCHLLRFPPGRVGLNLLLNVLLVLLWSPTTLHRVPPDSSYSSESPPCSRIYIVKVIIRHFLPLLFALVRVLEQSHAPNRRDSPSNPPRGKAQQDGLPRTPSHRAFLPDANFPARYFHPGNNRGSFGYALCSIPKLGMSPPI